MQAVMWFCEKRENVRSKSFICKTNFEIRKNRESKIAQVLLETSKM